MDIIHLTRGERFKDARIVHNPHGKQTLEEVCTATGVSASLIGDLENDDKNRSVGYEKIVILADHYQLPIDYLLERSEIRSLNPIIKEICEYTGLSQEAVERLHEDSLISDPPGYREFNSQLITGILKLGDDISFEALYALNQSVQALRIAANAKSTPDIVKWTMVSNAMNEVEGKDSYILTAEEAADYYFKKSVHLLTEHISEVLDAMRRTRFNALRKAHEKE